jgi:hypothetical protein
MGYEHGKDRRVDDALESKAESRYWADHGVCGKRRGRLEGLSRVLRVRLC